MKTIIEFNWNTNYIFILFHIIFILFKNYYSSSSKFNTKTNKNSIIMFELITECSLIISIIPFLIEKYRKKNLIKDKKIKYINKIKKIYKNNNSKILILIIISSLIKFNFTIFNFEVFNEYFYKINKFSNYYSNFIMILSLILFIFIRNKILKKNFYLHHLISMALIILTLIPIGIISLSIEDVNKYLGIKFLLYVYFYFYMFFLIFLGYMIYKILTEKYFISIYLINFFEGLFYIFYTFIFYNYKIKNDNVSNYGDPFEFDMTNLFITCILQNIVNIAIKLIIYYFDEIFVVISILISGSLNTILDMLLIKFTNFKRELSLLLLNIFLIFNLLIFIEVIIIKIFNLEKKTKKYLDKEQEREKNKIFNMDNTLSSIDDKSILN
jgi:hypothetical protein